MTPEGRREALANVFLLPTPFDKQSALVESWLAEKDAEIERLRTELVERDDRYNGYLDKVDVRIRADERRRTAEEIAQRFDAYRHDYSGRAKSIVRAYEHAARIAREVGGSE